MEDAGRDGESGPHGRARAARADGTARPGRPGRAAKTRPGRRRASSRTRIGAVALELFIARGFDATSMDDVAAAAGVSRRTLFRYFPSKAALPWGDFGGMLEVMRASFAAVPADIGTHTALADALVGFNSFPDAETERHRARMRLLLQVDTLTAHSALMYADWRLAVAEFVARRRGERPAALIPAAVAHAMLGVALAAYEVWSREPGTPQSRLHELLRDGVAIIDPEIH